MYLTILFTEAEGATAGIVVACKESDGDYSIVRHATESGDYVHAYVLRDNGFELLHSDLDGMTVQDALDRLD
jgi:hypothetical protein